MVMKLSENVKEHHRCNGGMSRFEKFFHYHKTFLGEELNQNQLDNLSKKFSKIVVQRVIDANEIPGALDFLKKCKLNKKICVINSATPLKEIKFIIKKKKLDKFFSAIYGSPNNKIANLKEAFLKFGFSSRHTIFFGNDYGIATLPKS